MQALTFDNESGIKAASYREIREALQNDFKRVFGDNINLAPSTPDGQLVDIFCYAFNALAQNLQQVATCLNVATASGVFLDYLAQITVGGRNTGESDETLIKRIQNAEHYGYATAGGMLTYLQKNVDANAVLSVNDSSRDEGGIKPFSFMVSVSADCEKTNDEIASAIWTCKPAGIKSCGNQSGEVSTPAGKKVVYFSRVSAVDVYLKIVISEYDEENLPADYAARIKNAVTKWAVSEYTNGKDVLTQRIFTPVFSVPGISTVHIYTRLKATDEWSEASRVEIAATNYARITTANIEVVK